jgi:hypothetical protein
MMEQGATRRAGAALHLEGGRACKPDLDQALDGRVEQRAPRLVPALLLRSRDPGELAHRQIVYRSKNSQSRLFVLVAVQLAGNGRVD